MQNCTYTMIVLIVACLPTEIMAKSRRRDSERDDERSRNGTLGREQRAHKRYKQSFGGYGGYTSQTTVSKSEDGESGDPFTTTMIRVSVHYIYRVHSSVFVGPLFSMDTTTMGSGEDQQTSNSMEPGAMAEYLFGEPSEKEFIPFIWGGFRFSNSSSGSGENESSRSGLTYGGGAGAYLMLAANIALTPRFEYSMGNHTSKAGEYSASTSYSTTQLLVGLSLLK